MESMDFINHKYLGFFRDDYSSRANSETIELFRSCNVRLITFHLHCTHALQQFDVGIAKKLKSIYTKLLLLLFFNAINKLDFKIRTLENV